MVSSQKNQKSDLSKKIHHITPKVQPTQIQIIDSEQEEKPIIKQKKFQHKKQDQKIQQKIQQKIVQQQDQQIIQVSECIYFKPLYLHRNYKSHIKPVLQKISQPNSNQLSLFEVIKAITYFKEEFQVHRQNKVMQKRNTKDNAFQILINFYSILAKQVFSLITKFLLQSQHNQSFYQIPLFQASQEFTKNITKWQALFVMCCMTMCLIIQQKSDLTEKVYRFSNLIDFSDYFTSNQWKTKCILQYLRIQLNNFYHPTNKSLNQRILTVKRVICPLKLQKILKKDGDKCLRSINIPNDDVTMDDFYKQLKICHTNQFLGGGQLLGGLSQEDIFFSAHTQLHILMVLCEQLNQSDCVSLIGFRKYFRIERTKFKIVFDGQDHDYPLQIDSQGRIKDYISFISHPRSIRQNFKDQFKKQAVDAEIAIYYTAIKIFMEMKNVSFKKIVSGHWANTMIWGDPRKKLTTLWIAASMLQRDLTFCPYGQFKIIYDKDFFFQMKNKESQWVYQKLLMAGKKMIIFRDNLHVFMMIQAHTK